MRKSRIEFKAVIKACTVVLAMLLAGCGGGGGSGDRQTADADTYTLSGTIQAPDNALVDSDVNDTSATYAPNDSFAEAQQLPETLGPEQI